jgi:hypothetical protein
VQARLVVARWNHLFPKPNYAARPGNACLSDGHSLEGHDPDQLILRLARAIGTALANASSTAQATACA